MTDDNWGNIRRLPSADERNRSGGAGIYYHFDYVGGPAQLQMDQHQSAPENLGANEIWRSTMAQTRIWIVTLATSSRWNSPCRFFLAFAWEGKQMD